MIRLLMLNVNTHLRKIDVLLIQISIKIKVVEKIEEKIEATY